MSAPRKGKTICPECGKEHDIWIWNSINLEQHPEASDKLRSLEYFRRRCPQCGKQSIVLYPLACYDRRWNVLVQLHAGENRERFFHLDEQMEGGMRLCTVYHAEDLAEKVLALQNGRDDRIVEMCKFWMLLKFAKHLNDFELDRLYYSIEDGEEKIVGVDVDGRKAIADFPRNVYRQFDEAFREVLPLARAKNNEYTTEWADTFVREHIDLLNGIRYCISSRRKATIKP